MLSAGVSVFLPPPPSATILHAFMRRHRSCRAHMKIGTFRPHAKAAGVSFPHLFAHRSNNNRTGTRHACERGQRGFTWLGSD